MTDRRTDRLAYYWPIADGFVKFICDSQYRKVIPNTEQREHVRREWYEHGGSTHGNQRIGRRVT